MRAENLLGPLYIVNDVIGALLVIFGIIVSASTQHVFENLGVYFIVAGLFLAVLNIFACVVGFRRTNKVSAVSVVLSVLMLLVLVICLSLQLSVYSSGAWHCDLLSDDSCQIYGDCGYEPRIWELEPESCCRGDFLLGDGDCNIGCNVSALAFDGGDCLIEPCTPLDGSSCPTSLLGDGSCDDECNNPECNYDYGDCPPPPEDGRGGGRGGHDSDDRDGKGHDSSDDGGKGGGGKGNKGNSGKGGGRALDWSLAEDDRSLWSTSPYCPSNFTSTIACCGNDELTQACSYGTIGSEACWILIAAGMVTTILLLMIESYRCCCQKEDVPPRGQPPQQPALEMGRVAVVGQPAPQIAQFIKDGSKKSSKDNNIPTATPASMFNIQPAGMVVAAPAPPALDLQKDGGEVQVV